LFLKTPDSTSNPATINTPASKRGQFFQVICLCMLGRYQIVHNEPRIKLFRRVFFLIGVYRLFKRYFGKSSKAYR
jgi:hypothetical protein